MNKCFLHICLKFLKICSFFNFSRSSTIFTKLMIFVPFCASFLVHFAPYFCACLSILSGVWIAFNNSWYIKEFVLWRFFVRFLQKLPPCIIFFLLFLRSINFNLEQILKWWIKVFLVRKKTSKYVGKYCSHKVFCPLKGQ